MRIGNWLGGAVIWHWPPSMEWQPTARTAEHVTTVPLGGALDRQSGDRYYGVYVPTRFGGELQVKTTSGKIVDLKGPNGAARTQRPRHRRRPARMVYIQSMRAPRSPTRWKPPSFRSPRASRKPWNFYYWPTKADSIHEPWAGGNARVDTMSLQLATTC